MFLDKYIEKDPIIKKTRDTLKNWLDKEFSGVTKKDVVKLVKELDEAIKNETVDR